MSNLKQLKLFKISISKNAEKDDGLAFFTAAIIVAASEDEAKNIHPYDEYGFRCHEKYKVITDPSWVWDGNETTTWCSSSEVIVEYLGEAAEHLSAGTVHCAAHRTNGGCGAV